MMQLIVFRESEKWWIGQCVEKDICVQSKSEDGVVAEFKGMLATYKELAKEQPGYDFNKNHPSTPAEVIERIKKIKGVKIIEVPE